jgi:hypothetical protein
MHLHKLLGIIFCWNFVSLPEFIHVSNHLFALVWIQGDKYSLDYNEIVLYFVAQIVLAFEHGETK